jgi:putative transposase
VRKVLVCAGVPPAPERARQSWRSFLRQQAANTLACDFFTVETLALQRIYVLFFISPATRRLEFIACTANPDGAWVTQQARNLLMQLGEHERRFRLLIHDRDRKFSRGFDEVFRCGGIEVIRTRSKRRTRTPSLSAGCEPCAATASTEFSSSDGAISNASCASIPTTTTGIARTARSNSPRQTAPIQTSSAALPPRLASTGTTCSAD